MTNIKRLQKCAIPLGPDSTQREYLLKHVIAYANDYLDNISEAPAYIPRPDSGRELWDFPITEDGIDIKQALALLCKNMDAAGINPTSGRFLGYIPGGSWKQPGNRPALNGSKAILYSFRIWDYF